MGIVFCWDRRQRQMLRCLVSQLRKTMRETKFISTKKRQPPLFSGTVRFFIGKNQRVPVLWNLCRLDYVRQLKLYHGQPKHLGQPAQNLNVEHNLNPNVGFKENLLKNLHLFGLFNNFVFPRCWCFLPIFRNCFA